LRLELNDLCLKLGQSLMIGLYSLNAAPCIGSQAGELRVPLAESHLVIGRAHPGVIGAQLMSSHIAVVRLLHNTGVVDAPRASKLASASVRELPEKPRIYRE